MPHHECFLSPADQWMPAFNFPIWLVFKTEVPDAALVSAQDGFQRTLAQLPFLAGDIAPVLEEHSAFKLRWSDQTPAVVWEEMVAPERMNLGDWQRGDFAMSDLGTTTLPPRFWKSLGDDRKPVVMAAYMKLEGGLMLFMAIYHALTDAGGFASIFNLWAATSRAWHIRQSRLILKSHWVVVSACWR